MTRLRFLPRDCRHMLYTSALTSPATGLSLGLIVALSVIWSLWGGS